MAIGRLNFKYIVTYRAQFIAAEVSKYFAMLYTSTKTLLNDVRVKNTPICDS
jgi:hypothetical protein